jgi:ABC-type polysaccharide/polyol phosphate transport system ATPase subunit
MELKKILVVDEVLAVGDLEFQRKCHEKNERCIK